MIFWSFLHLNLLLKLCGQVMWKCLIILVANLQKPQIQENYSLQILSSITLFVIAFFFIFWVGSFFEADIFPLENRSTYHTSFNFYIFEKYVDALIISLLTIFWLGLSIRGKERIVSSIIYGGLTAASFLTNFNPLLEASVLVSVPLIASFFAYQHFSTKKIISIQSNLLFSLFSYAVLCIAVSGFIVTILSLSSTFELPSWIKNHSLVIFLLFSSFSPVLIFFLVAGSIIKLLTIKGNKEAKSKIWQLHIVPQKVKRKSRYLFLCFFILLSILLAVFPHQSFINNENELVGVDTPYYVNWLNYVMVEDQSEFIHRVFVVPNSGDRPISLLLFSVVFSIFPENPSQGIDHLPIILSPILVLAVFFLTREVTSNDTVSLLASFLTAISFQALIGIYSGFYANWLALIFGYLSIAFMLRFLKRPTGINYLVFSILLFLIMLSHVHTWSLMMLFLGIFLIASSRLKIFKRKRIALVFLIIVASIAFDVGKSILTESPGGIESDVSLAGKRANYGNLAATWSNLFQTSIVFAGGQFGNFLILSLCIYWLLRSNLRIMPNLFIAVFLSIAILPILFGDYVIQSRVLYNISFQIPAAIGLFYLSSQHRGNLLVVSTCIWILAVSIQAISNFI